MGGIVIFTVPGLGKREFVNRLHEESGGNVDLVIIIHTHRKRFLKRIGDFIKKVGFWGLPRELWFVFLWFLSPRVRHAHEWLKARSGNTKYAKALVPKVINTESVNTNEVYTAVAAVSPRLIVIWGGTIVKSPILTRAPHAINMHFGWCPYYRGTNCNHHALLQNDFKHVGITIHRAVEAVDAGEVLSIIPADLSKKTHQEIFRDLNDRGESMYVTVALRLFRGEHVPSVTQNLSEGKNYRLNEWTYEKRYRLGQILLNTERQPFYLKKG